MMHLANGLDVLPVFQSKRDILSETKYIELVLVADHQEVSERTIATCSHLPRRPCSQGAGLAGVEVNVLTVCTDSSHQGALLQTDTNVLLIFFPLVSQLSEEQ